MGDSKDAGLQASGGAVRAEVKQDGYVMGTLHSPVGGPAASLALACLLVWVMLVVSRWAVRGATAKQHYPAVPIGYVCPTLSGEYLIQLGKWMKAQEEASKAGILGQSLPPSGPAVKAGAK